jgi:hypothetical protein
LKELSDVIREGHNFSWIMPKRYSPNQSDVYLESHHPEKEYDIDRNK